MCPWWGNHSNCVLSGKLWGLSIQAIMSKWEKYIVVREQVLRQFLRCRIWDRRISDIQGNYQEEPWLRPGTGIRKERVGKLQGFLGSGIWDVISQTAYLIYLKHSLKKKSWSPKILLICPGIKYQNWVFVHFWLGWLGYWAWGRAWTTPDSVWGLLLALCLGVVPDNVKRPWGAGGSSLVFLPAKHTLNSLSCLPSPSELAF